MQPIASIDRIYIINRYNELNNYGVHLYAIIRENRSIGKKSY